MAKLDDRVGLARIWHNLASILMGRGDYNSAMVLLQKSLNEKEMLRDLSGQAASLHNLARVYFALGNIESALESISKAIELQKTLGDLFGQMRSFVLMADLSLRAKKPESARRFLERAKYIANEISSPEIKNISEKLKNLEQFATAQSSD